MWMPIETAPKGVDVLLFCPDGVCTKVFVGYWDDDMDGVWLTPEEGEIAQISGHPTFWQPLPDSPLAPGDLPTVKVAFTDEEYLAGAPFSLPDPPE